MNGVSYFSSKKIASVTYMGHYTRSVIIGSVLIESFYLTFTMVGYPSLAFDINKQAVLIIWAVQITPLRAKRK